LSDLSIARILAQSLTYDNGVIHGALSEIPARRDTKGGNNVKRGEKNVKPPEQMFSMCHYSLKAYLPCVSGIFFLVYLQDRVVPTRICEVTIKAAEAVVPN
jgi:hypothetical protein